MRSATADRRIVILLVAALAIEMLLLLWHMGIVSWKSGAQSNSNLSAGVVAKSENHLRRRSLNSLIWERSESKETLFFHDSILTLSQSSATLLLDQGSEIELSENTLVTIEPPVADGRGEIRLRFSRGSVASRNPFNTTKIEADDFSVDIKPGSELQLNQVGDREFEVSVQKGEALVKSADGLRTVNASTRVRISQGKSSDLITDPNLRWTETPPGRIYVHGDVVDVRLSWEGAADEMVWQKVGSEEQAAPLTPEDKVRFVALGLGQHTLYLRGEDGVSAPLKVQVWPAPVLHLLAPLPRNRIRTNEPVQFLWTLIPEAQSYELKFKGATLESEYKVMGNAHKLTFESEDNSEWSVWARDTNGFLIPPLYSYPIYFREQPLAAPKLKSPMLRAPAGRDRGAWYRVIDLILPRAQADELETFEAVFEWEAVEDAHEYWIEISESADFRAPVITQRISKTSFVWDHPTKRNYFWRVAAAGTNGRMGLFSEPAELRLSEAEGEGLVSGVQVRKKAVAPPAATADLPKNAIPPAEKTPAPPAPSVEPKPIVPLPVEGSPQADSEYVLPEHKPSGITVLARGGFGNLQAHGAESIKGTFTGMEFGASAEMDVAKGEDHWWRLYVSAGQTTFKPKPEAKYPVQEDLKIEEGKIRATRFRAQTSVAYGLSVLRLTQIERTGEESIKTVGKFGMAPHVTGLWGKRIQYQSDLGLIMSESGFGVYNDHRLLFRLSWGVQLGLQAEGTFVGTKDNQSVSTDAFLLLGYEF